MEIDKIIDLLGQIALMLEKCSEDVPYELSAKDNLYFRMVDASNEARELIKDAKHL